MVMPSDELARARLDMSATLPGTCDILSLTRASDGQGGWAETWGTASAGVACRIAAQRGAESIGGAAVLASYTFVLSVPYDTALTEAHRVKSDGITYTVRAVDRGKSQGLLKRAIIERVAE